MLGEEQPEKEGVPSPLTPNRKIQYSQRRVININGHFES